MIVSDRFEKRRNDKKKAIIQTALELSNRYGFGRVTVAKIAERAHVSEVSIYNFFESKDNLWRIIIRDMLDGSIGKIKSLITKEGNFIEKIEEYIQIRAWYYGKYTLRFSFEAVESDPELRQYPENFNTTSKNPLMTFIEKDKDLGVFSSDTPNDVAEIHIDMIQTYLVHSKGIRDRLEHNPELAREINMLLLGGLIRNMEE